MPTTENLLLALPPAILYLACLIAIFREKRTNRLFAYGALAAACAVAVHAILYGAIK